ncbi:MAG: site-specific integrase [Lentisphaerae bacterium]|jgi:integrase|nr:site-specific integrase [Lentisphaerota bacterium]MBT4820253.1 site-specific integrase [Lentisphaerota bacterium]MBT5606013.1 site-specific integrase [Lentisphaerota bacterium]MBT7058598.1 site-specific integrase [Lentisphaerota bacterium]MBT7845452.1 site-specific integrase [Lentisphaerota bacterium]
MSVFRKKMPNGELSPTYYYKFYVGGKRFRGSTGETHEREAKRVEARKKAFQEDLYAQKTEKAVIENYREQLSGGKRIPLAEAWASFLKKPRQYNTSQREILNHHARWQDFLAFLSGEHAEIEVINDVTTRMAEQYVHRIRTEGRYEKSISYRRTGEGKDVEYKHRIKKVSANTANRYLLSCKMVFRALQDEAAMPQNPFGHIQPLSLKGKIAKRDVYTFEELTRIEKAARGQWFYPLFMVGVNTGLSEGDICTLQWQEISPDHSLITTDRNKTAAELRIPCMPALQKYLATLERDGEYVFPELVRRYLTSKVVELPNGGEKVTFPLRGGIGKALTKFLQGRETKKGRKGGIGIESSRVIEGRDRRASVRDAHSLRHTFIYLAGMNGLELPLVQSLVGHMTPEMTKMYMDHASDEAKREAMQRMPNFLGGGTPLPLPDGTDTELVRSVREQLHKATPAEIKAIHGLAAAMMQATDKA